MVLAPAKHGLVHKAGKSPKPACHALVKPEKYSFHLKTTEVETTKHHVRGKSIGPFRTLNFEFQPIRSKTSKFQFAFKTWLANNTHKIFPWSISSDAGDLLYSVWFLVR